MTVPESFNPNRAFDIVVPAEAAPQLIKEIASMGHVQYDHGSASGSIYQQVSAEHPISTVYFLYSKDAGLLHVDAGDDPDVKAHVKRMLVDQIKAIVPDHAHKIA